MSSATPTQFRSLSTAEKLQLIETNEDLGLTAEQKIDLDRRIDDLKSRLGK